eukprot:11624179-Alexandrium_andersonii.AAC.1
MPVRRPLVSVRPRCPLPQPGCGYGGRDTHRSQKRLVPGQGEGPHIAHRPSSRVREETARGGPTTRSACPLDISNYAPGGSPSSEYGSDEPRV